MPGNYGASFIALHQGGNRLAVLQHIIYNILIQIKLYSKAGISNKTVYIKTNILCKSTVCISFGQFDCTGDWSILPLDLPSSIGRTMIKLNSLKTFVFNSISSMGSLRKNLDDQVGILNTFKEHIQKNSLKCHHGQQFGGH